MEFDTIAIVEKLIAATKDNSISWFYLDTDTELKGIAYSRITKEHKTPIPRFNDDSTFACNAVNGYFVLIEQSRVEPPILYLVSVPSRDSRDICVLNPNEVYQEDLLRLQNSIKKQLPNTEDFLKAFLDS